MPCCDWLPVSRDPVVIGRRLPMAASVSRSVSFDTAPACKSNICIYYIINSFSSKRYLPYVLFKSLFRYTGILKISSDAFSLIYYTVLRSRNYLFSAPAPATAIYCHLKLFYKSNNLLIEVENIFSSS